MVRGEDSPLVVSRSPKQGDGGKGQVDLVEVGGCREVKAGGMSGFSKGLPYGQPWTLTTKNWWGYGC